MEYITQTRSNSLRTRSVKSGDPVQGVLKVMNYTTSVTRIRHLTRGRYQPKENNKNYITSIERSWCRHQP